jgi:hypothetical protein
LIIVAPAAEIAAEDVSSASRLLSDAAAIIGGLAENCEDVFGTISNACTIIDKARCARRR